MERRALHDRNLVAMPVVVVGVDMFEIGPDVAYQMVHDLRDDFGRPDEDDPVFRRNVDHSRQVLFGPGCGRCRGMT